MRGLRLLAALLLPALLLACGGGDDDASPEESPPAPTRTPAPTTVSSSDAPAGDPEPAWFGDYLAEGDCWDDTFDDAGDWDYSGIPESLPCDQAHDNEVMLIVALGADADPFPGDDAVHELDDDICDAAFAEYVGVPWGQTPLDWFSLWPAEEEWEQGARTLVCSAYLPVTYGTGAKVTGSLRGIGNAAIPALLPAGVPIPAGAVFSDLNTAEDGSLVAMFEFPGTREEAIAAVAAAFEADAAWQATARGGTDLFIAFAVTGPGFASTAVINNFAFGVQWWLYLPPE